MKKCLSTALWIFSATLLLCSCQKEPARTIFTSFCSQHPSAHQTSEASNSRPLSSFDSSAVSSVLSQTTLVQITLPQTSQRTESLPITTQIPITVTETPATSVPIFTPPPTTAVATVPKTTPKTPTTSVRTTPQITVAPLPVTKPQTTVSVEVLPSGTLPQIDWNQ